MGERDTLLVRRGRMGLVLAILAIVLFVLLDVGLHPDDFAALFLIRGGLALAFAAVAAVLPRSPFREHAGTILLLTTTALCVATAATAVRIGELEGSQTVFIVIVLVTASFVPWGARAQAGAVVAAAASLLWNILAVRGAAGLLDYSNVSALVAFAVSVYMAHAFEGARREADERARAVRESEELFRKTFATMPEAMTISRLKDGILISVNEGFVQLTEFTAAEAVGRRSTDLGIFVDPQAWAAGVARLRTQGSLVNAEAEFRTKSGRALSGLASATVVTIAGEPHVVTSVRDVSTQKAAERMRRDLVRMLSHDIKNPLAASIGFTDILREQLRDHLDPTEAIDAIESCSQQAMSLAVNFLEADRIETTGSLELRKGPCSVHQVVERVVRQEGARARRRSISLRTEIEELPPVALDEALVERAIGNLVSNAIKFSPEGAEVVVAVALRGGQVVVEVRDRGPGIPPRDVPLLFQRYARGTIARRDSTGLGLFIVKTIAEAHGGTVDVRSPVPGGSAFVLSIPVEPSRSRGATESPASS